MSRIVRYQGAVIRDDSILLIKHREHASRRDYWVIPGGGREGDETEEACVWREVREETCLDVVVERLLLDEPGPPGGTYQRLKTYLCLPMAGEASPGREPEFGPSEGYEIIGVGWLNLHDEATWGTEVVTDPFTYPLLQRIRAVLGYCRDQDRAQHGATDR